MKYAIELVLFDDGEQLSRSRKVDLELSSLIPTFPGSQPPQGGHVGGGSPRP